MKRLLKYKKFENKSEAVEEIKDYFLDICDDFDVEISSDIGDHIIKVKMEFDLSIDEFFDMMENIKNSISRIRSIGEFKTCDAWRRGNIRDKAWALIKSAVPTTGVNKHTRTNYLGDDDLENLDLFKTDILSSHDTEITLYHNNPQSSEEYRKVATSVTRVFEIDMLFNWLGDSETNESIETSYKYFTDLLNTRIEEQNKDISDHFIELEDDFLVNVRCNSYTTRLKNDKVKIGTRVLISPMSEFKFEHLEKLISTIRNIVLRINSMGEFQTASSGESGRLTWQIRGGIRSLPHNIIIDEDWELDWERMRERFLDVLQDRHTGKLKWDWSDVQMIEIKFHFIGKE